MSQSKSVSQCIWMLILLNLALSNPIQNDDGEGYFIESRLNNYRKRFAMLANNIDEKYAADLKEVVEKFDDAFSSHDFLKEEFIIEHFVEKLNPDFAAYLQYQLDFQYLNQEITMERWFLEQLIPVIGSAELAEDLKSLLQRFDKAKLAADIDEKFEHFSNVDSEVSQGLLDFFQADPVPSAILSVQLQYFRELLLYLRQELQVGEFENDIKSLLKEVEQAFGSVANDDKKRELIDRFDHIDTKLERFLDAKAHEFELYKFGME